MSDDAGSQGFQCAQCREWHDSLLSDVGFELPDVVWQLEFLDRYRRARFNSDLCTLDESRYFIRAMLSVPLQYADDHFGWGLWVEVDKAHHDLYVERYHQGGDAIPAFSGTIANDIETYPGLIGEVVSIKPFDAHRPTLRFPEGAVHPLAREQREGLSLARHHEIAELYA